MFAGLGPSEIDDLRGRLQRRRYAPQQTIFLEGDPGGALCIIESGQVKLAVSSSQGHERIFELLRAADFFGELSVIDGEPRSADAVAVEQSVIWLLSREDFLAFIRRYPRVMEQLLYVLARRLRRDASIMQDAAFLDVPARIARTLLRIAPVPLGADEVMSTPVFKQADLAGMVGTTRETLNKWLGIFEKQHLIQRQRGRINILRPDALRKRIY